jgi:hypothetical protein
MGANDRMPSLGGERSFAYGGATCRASLSVDLKCPKPHAPREMWAKRSGRHNRRNADFDGSLHLRFGFAKSPVFRRLKIP